MTMMQWKFEPSCGQHFYYDARLGTLAVVWERFRDNHREGNCHILVAGWDEASTEPQDLDAAKAKAERAVRKLHGV